MKKFATIATFIAVVSVPVFAASTQGGFTGPTATTSASQTPTQTRGFVDASASQVTAAQVKE